LLASIAGILILLRLKLHPSLAIFAGSLIVSLLVLPPKRTPELMLQNLLDLQTLRLLAIVACALTLSRLMEVKGLLAKLAGTMERIGPKLAMHLVPAIIGLVPMPAGALVSATALKDLANRIGLTPAQATFINYWFRHIWECSLPVYPAIITASVILSVPLPLVIKTLFPISLLTVAIGIPYSYRILKRKKLQGTREEASGNIARDLLKAAWPVFLLVLLVLLGLDAALAFLLSLSLLILQQRAKWPELERSLKYGLDPKMLFLLYAVMLYKAAIESSGAAYALFSDMQSIGMPTLVILIALPLLIGFATGLSMGFVGVTFPLLVPFMASNSGVNTYALFVAYASGVIGYLLSPLHLCLILSAEYFQAKLARVYNYIVPPLLAIGAITVAIYCIAG